MALIRGGTGFRLILSRFSRHVSEHDWFAVGVDLLVLVLGIFLGLQVTNWNEDRKVDQLANANYLNLLSSLQQDSLAAQRTLESNAIGLMALRKIVPMKHNEELLGLSGRDLDNYLHELSLSSRSFIPNSGIYDLLTSTNGLDMIKSEKIKTLLVDLYDNQYKGYGIVDAPIDDKYMHELGSVIKEKIGLVVEYTPDMSVVHSASPELFVQHYSELAAESRDIYSMLSYNMETLKEIEASIGELVSLIEDEIEQ